MLELSPYLIVTTFNMIKNNRGISDEEIIEQVHKKTGLSSERLKETIIKSIDFLLDAKLIEVLPAEKKKYKKADKAKLSISESISNGFTRKAKEIARRTVSTIPAGKIREALIGKNVSDCILVENPLAIKCQSPIGETEYLFELKSLDSEKEITDIIKQLDSYPKYQIIYDAPLIENLDLKFEFPEDKKISASDASRYTFPVQSPVATNDLSKSRQLLFTVASASRWVGNFSSDGPVGEFQSIPDLVDIDDSFGYAAIDEITTLNQQEFVADQNFAQSYFQMERMHNEIDLIGFEEQPTNYHIRDGPIVPHSYRDPKFYEALDQSKKLVDIALNRNILYFGFVKYSADKALTSFINNVIFSNILKGSVPENFWSDFGLLSQVLEDKDVTVPIVRLDRGFDDQKRKCLVPYMSFYLKIFDWVSRIDVPWFICKNDPIGYRNNLAQLVYSLSSIEYSKPGGSQIVPFPIAMVDEMARIVAQNFIDISIKQFYEELGRLIDNE
ncbi:MAG TPA: DNA double-strand break repair nuclease NurA [Candidatus Bathyarchaeia archaeon]|nr:DNA double-strand break repair nuclease NurA [Candidatus Bathyarchaeia archaeon]